jgi:hypothetical protein
MVKWDDAEPVVTKVDTTPIKVDAPKADRTPPKKKVDPATKRRWIETLAKLKGRAHSDWRTDINELIEYLLD